MKEHAMRLFSIVIRPFVVCCVMFLLPACQHGNTVNVQGILGFPVSVTQLDRFIDAQMKEQGMPGLSLIIINDGAVVYHAKKGFADREQRMPIHDSSIFEGASISKSVFAYFVMTFVDDGMIDLDVPLYTYLPYPDIEHDAQYKLITARMVLSHRTGLPNWRDDYEDKRLFLQFEPGTDYLYSGEGYQYLALVLKHLLKTNWAGLEAEFQKRVTNPLQMHHTRFIQNDFLREYKVQPYDKNGKRIDKSDMEWWRERDTVFVAPTSIHSEALDFSKWVIAIMNESGLTKEGFKTLYQTHASIGGNFIMRSDYGLGLGKTTLFNAKTFYSHNGNNTGFSSLFLFDKDRKWGLIYFTNAESGDAFGNSLIYKMLLTGWTEAKQLCLVFLIALSLMMLLSGCFLYFYSHATLRRFQKLHLAAALLTLSAVLSSLGFLVFTTITIGPILYIASAQLLLALALAILSFWRTILSWEKQITGGAVLLFHGCTCVVFIFLVALFLLV